MTAFLTGLGMTFLTAVTTFFVTFWYILPGEKVEPGEIVKKEDLDVVLEELKEF